MGLVTGPPARRRILAAVLAVLLCTATAACAAEPDQRAGPPLDEITFLNILPLESLSFAPEMVATAGGYFERHGLDVHFEATQGSPPALQTVIAGSALLTRVGDIETMVAAGERGAPLVVVGSALPRGPVRMVSSRREPITTADGFRGKLVGIPSQGGTSEFTLNLVLAAKDVPAADVQRQVVGLAPGVFDLVRAGRLDAYVVSLDTSVILLHQQPDAVVYDPNADIAAGAQVYVTSADQAADPAQQDRLRRYLLAVREAMQFIADDAPGGFAQTKRIIASRYEVPSLTDPGVADDALQRYLASYTAPDGGGYLSTSPDRWAVAYEEMAGLGLVRPDLDPSRWMTNQFLPT
ncbi:ABC transporter substrate-binding protein [Pseudonocardia charpentierae]|uniref:ABC transporter substrate-binding protein n=1 Tax=Pseudonocardia charpentierae TaxID=3075545 RepID=A0ABU2NDZ1_9PSEU|nr:ABC transporter substrate-binding protein [Pseudonocardia sp. DSM 45834]MDT0352172.1 ABC transporter substrate-binding protein [Pseudonocardia sp. DSM 45834]